jgi:hypothetical protein
MRDFRLSFPACVIAGKTRLDLHDVVLLKTYSLPHGVRCHRDAMTLLVLNACCPEKCAEWQAYFIETMASYIVEVLEPQNGIDRKKLQWMTDIFTTDGLANSCLESRLLQHVMDVLAEPSKGMQPAIAARRSAETTALAAALRNLAEQLSTGFEAQRSPASWRSTQDCNQLAF